MKTNISEFLQAVEPCPIIPVLSIQNIEDAVPLVDALAAGGLNVIEITLRTEAALTAIKAIRAALPEVTVGAGTILNPQQFDKALAAGSQFVVSPGSTPALLQHGAIQTVPFIPGIQTVSELMVGIDAGYQMFKFFPAGNAGGPAVLRALQGPFADIRFCPTGGITAENADEYLALKNVECVGGTWLAPQPLIAARDWPSITRLAQTALSRVHDLSTQTRSNNAAMP